MGNRHGAWETAAETLWETDVWFSGICFDECENKQSCLVLLKISLECAKDASYMGKGWIVD